MMFQRASLISCVAFALAAAAPAPVEASPAAPAFAQQFVVAPGRRAAVFGSAEGGLEVWAYPLQLLGGYRLRFVEADHVAPIEAAPLLRRVERRGAAVVRVYVGPDFVVRERLFAPSDARGVVLDYEVEGRPDVRIEARFQPSLDLMWPGALGGQSVQWEAQRSAYVEREPVHGFAAMIRSPQAVAHDSTANAASARDDGLALLLAPTGSGPGVRRAQVFVTAEPAAGPELSAQLEAQTSALRDEAQARLEAAQAQSLRIVTPDGEVNAALADAEAALEQAWVCAPDLGCGEVAGYGPSRPGRRPQYAWFFAGDGLIATEALIATGRFERAREELAFVARYQNPANGMIWHEMSLSAPLIDWARRYPYMYVHVDITLQYLATLGDYVRATGDRGFVTEHWAGIEAAWRYALGLVDAKTGLPTIPAGKQGQNEQAVLRDDVGLSSAFIDAADGVAQLAEARGRPALTAQAQAAAERARRAVGAGSWDARRGYWVNGHTLDGAAMTDARSDAVRLLGQGVFTPAQVGVALDKLATPDFQTDWGVRSLSAADPAYDPNAYSQGAVWALGTSGAATAFWTAHRPLTAWPAWRGLVGWNTLDAPGHLHEVLAGDLHHPERESVPAQTWSSAALLTSAVHGLLGLEADAAARKLVFAPNLPATWDHVRIEGVRVGASRLALAVTQDAGAVTLEVRNDGPPVAIDFAPALPLGARMVAAETGGAPANAAFEPHDQDPHARLALMAGAGVTRVAIRYTGGVRVAPPTTAAEVGDPSRNLKLASARWDDGSLTLRAYVADPARATIGLVTRLKAIRAEGGALTPTAQGYALTPDAAAAGDHSVYRPVEMRVIFAR